MRSQHCFSPPLAAGCSFAARPLNGSACSHSLVRTDLVIAPESVVIVPKPPFFVSAGPAADLEPHWAPATPNPSPERGHVPAAGCSLATNVPPVPDGQLPQTP